MGTGTVWVIDLNELPDVILFRTVISKCFPLVVFAGLAGAKYDSF